MIKEKRVLIPERASRERSIRFIDIARDRARGTSSKHSLSLLSGQRIAIMPVGFVLNVYNMCLLWRLFHSFLSDRRIYFNADLRLSL